jgi:hypothetical protein
MTDQINEPGADSEVLATGNDSTAEASSPVERVESAPKKESVRESVMRAMESTSKPDPEKKKGAEWPVAKPVEAQTPKNVDPISGRELESIKAPSSMTPGLREKWNGVDRQMQQFWVDRERDMNAKLQETADERKLATEFRGVASPYEAHFRSVGMSAPKYASELFNIDHQLRSGTPQQKAQILHRMIMQFQPDANTLGQLARGQQPVISAPAPKPVDVSAEVEKTLAAREQAAGLKRAQDDLQKFKSDPKNEFYEDVRDLMHKAVVAGFVGGETDAEVYKNAYEFACNQHPEVRGIIASRATAGQPTAKAVGSVKPSLGTGRSNSSAPVFKSRREAVLAAWDKSVK